MLRLAKLFRGWGADVVHAHNTKPLIYCGPAARLARVPAAVYTRHGPRDVSPLGEELLYHLTVRSVHRAVCVSEDGARWPMGDRSRSPPKARLSRKMPLKASA